MSDIAKKSDDEFVAEMDGMCMDVAPGYIACCQPFSTINGCYLTPWCHLKKGHPGPHVYRGEWKWEGKAAGG